MRKVTELTVQTAALGSELQAAHSLLEEMRGENNLPDGTTEVSGIKTFVMSWLV